MKLEIQYPCDQISEDSFRIRVGGTDDIVVYGKTKEGTEIKAQNIVSSVNEYGQLKKLISDILECVQEDGKSDNFQVSNRLKVHDVKTMIISYHNKNKTR